MKNIIFFKKFKDKITRVILIEIKLYHYRDYLDTIEQELELIIDQLIHTFLLELII